MRGYIRGGGTERRGEHRVQLCSECTVHPSARGKGGRREGVRGTRFGVLMFVRLGMRRSGERGERLDQGRPTLQSMGADSLLSGAAQVWERTSPGSPGARSRCPYRSGITSTLHETLHPTRRSMRASWASRFLIPRLAPRNWRCSRCGFKHNTKRGIFRSSPILLQRSLMRQLPNDDLEGPSPPRTAKPFSAKHSAKHNLRKQPTS